ncbi:MFS transporter [Alkalihalobacillus sp. MEB130]|uniref:MFS transporter n=1 Tax=Alkalihalobacillus sp. MEB130 TaxID=2976704 RepID=UPI0028DDE43B|nr:MFS transporter [Alkalihalobacillus sp. MEB130]MDT8858925.1 MFS transporter [Alkalihalobacillus sp. MEB130]
MNKNQKPWQLLLVTSLGVLLVMLNMSTLNVALPELATHFQSGPTETSWILLSYMLFNTVLILVFGKISDVYGRRNLYLVGLVSFTVISLLCGFAPNVWFLIILRILQAASGALIITNTTPMIADAFSKKNLGTALGVNVLVSSVAQLLGPVIGGYLTYVLDWRWLFWFNVPIGVIGILWALFVIKKTSSNGKGEKIDLLGSLFILFGLGGLIIAFSQAGTTGWLHSVVIGGFVVFLVCCICFIWVERKVEFPIVDFSMFQNWEYSMANLATFLNSLARSSIVLLIALYFQLIHQENTFVAGLFVLPITGGVILASAIIGFLSGKFSIFALSTSGLLCSALGMLLLVFNTDANSSIYYMLIGQLLIGFGSGMFMTPNTQSIMLTVDRKKRGMANGLRSMLQNMGMVISTALSLMLVTFNLPSHLQSEIYAGANAQVSGNELHLISQGFQLAFGVMLFITILAIISSYLRKGRQKENIEVEVEKKTVKQKAL